MSTADSLISLLTSGKTVKFTVCVDSKYKTYFSRDYSPGTHALFDLVSGRLVQINLSTTSIACFSQTVDNFESEIKHIKEAINTHTREQLGDEGVELLTRDYPKFKPLIDKCFLFRFYDLYAIEVETDEFISAAKARWVDLLVARQKEVTDLLLADRKEFTETDAVLEIDTILTAIEAEVKKAQDSIANTKTYADLVKIWPPTLYPKPTP